MIAFIIPEPAPSWNDFYAGKHWTARKRLADKWHLLVRAAITPPIPKHDGPVTITVTVNYPDARRRDPDNVCAKLVIDGLVQAGVLPDDSDRYVQSVTTQITRDAGQKRTTVEIVERCIYAASAKSVGNKVVNPSAEEPC